MSPMRTGRTLLIILAIVIAAQPLVHTHNAASPADDHSSMSSAVSAPCAVCATANARVTVEAPALNVSLRVVDELCVAPAVPVTFSAVADLPARAPPVA